MSIPTIQDLTVCYESAYKGLGFERSDTIIVSFSTRLTRRESDIHFFVNEGTEGVRTTWDPEQDDELVLEILVRLFGESTGVTVAKLSTYQLVITRVRAFEWQQIAWHIKEACSGLNYVVTERWLEAGTPA